MTKKWFHKTNIKENTEDRTEFELIFQCRRKVYILSTSTEIKIMLCRIADHEVKKVLTASVFAKRFSSARKLNGLQCRAVNRSDTVVLWARGGQWISAGNLLTTVRIPAFFDLTRFYETNRSAWSLSRPILREKMSRFRRTGLLTYHPLK